MPRGPTRGKVTPVHSALAHDDRIAPALPAIDPALDSLRDARVLLDCRLLGPGGAGRTTELLLRSLQASPPPGRWLLWGPDSVQRYAWPGARWTPNAHPLGALKGQRDVLALPPHDIAVYLHQIRPLRPGPSLTVIYDTIQIRYNGSAPARLLKRLFLIAAARLSREVLTVSEYSHDRICADLHLPAAKVRLLRLPVDAAQAERVRRLREETGTAPEALFVGRFSPHKNLPRLLLAFARSRFRAGGGRLRLLGGGAEERDALMRWAMARGLSAGVQFEGAIAQAELERAYARARLLVQPSLEEGFGLPVWEALACGLPVAVSDGGSLPEIVGAAAVPAPARSVAALAAAIDRANEGPLPGGPPPTHVAARFENDLGAQLLAALAATRGTERGARDEEIENRK